MAWVGDSRAYLMRDGALQQLSEDHSLVNELIAAGRLSPDEAHLFPYRNVITRALGTSEEVEIAVDQTAWQVGDTLLLCSDGLTGMLDDDEIAGHLGAERPLVSCCEALVAAANAAGGTDNISVVLLRALSSDTIEAASA